MNPEHQYKGRLDLLSMVISMICLVHCVALPLLMAVLPVLGTSSVDWPFLEWGTVTLTALLGGWAIWKGYFTVHHQKSIVIAFAAGLLLVLVANFVTRDAVEIGCKGLGALLLIWAHLRNRAESRRCCTVLVNG